MAATVKTGDAGQPVASGSRARRTRRRQVHIWFSDREYEWLWRVADERDQTLSQLIRSMIVALRRSSASSAPPQN